MFAQPTNPLFNIRLSPNQCQRYVAGKTRIWLRQFVCLSVLWHSSVFQWITVKMSGTDVITFLGHHVPWPILKRMSTKFLQFLGIPWLDPRPLSDSLTILSTAGTVHRESLLDDVRTSNSKPLLERWRLLQKLGNKLLYSTGQSLQVTDLRYKAGYKQPQQRLLHTSALQPVTGHLDN